MLLNGQREKISFFFFLCFLKYSSYRLNNTSIKKNENGDFSGGPMVRRPPANEGNTGFMPPPERFHVLFGN